MNILFSPIGTADPLTTLGDGPMLHIVRHYQPDKVILFLSPKMAGYEDADQRYTKAINLLCGLTGQSAPELELVRSPRNDVYRFDKYIDEFEQQLRVLRDEDRRATILVNVSSGTPAMEQALVALGAFGRYDLTLLQVVTPRRDANKSDDRENPDSFDLDTLWELNPDNEDGRPKRIEEVDLPNFSDRLILEDVLSLIDAYDYAAALILCEQSSTVSQDAVSLIREAAASLNLDGKPAQSNQDKLAEYLWVLEVRMKQCHWADFVRSLTPAFTWTAKFALERSGLPQSAYLCHKPGGDPDEDYLDETKIRRNPKLYSILSKAISRGRPRHLENWMLSDLAQKYCESKVNARLQRIRAFEDKASRNKLAHQLSRANKRDIERRGGSTFEEVMNDLFKLNNVKPGKYDEINRQIRSLL